MLRLDLRHVFRVRGYRNPVKELRKLGISPTVAKNLVNGKTVSISNRHMELICERLNCTPNDLYAWSPEKGGGDAEGHPLSGLRRDPADASLADTLREVPLDKLKEARELLASLKNSD